MDEDGLLPPSCDLGWLSDTATLLAHADIYLLLTKTTSWDIATYQTWLEGYSAGNPMAAYLELWRPDGTAMVPLDSHKVTVGRSSSNDVAIPGDHRASRLHAVLERYSAGWCIRDLGSRNGTFVNGDRVVGERPLHPGDEVRIGSTRLVYRPGGAGQPDAVTESAAPPPELTRREREVLLALFRPALASEVFTEPASTREIAADLFVSEAAVKQHLLRLYDKFGIHGEGERRRVRLANEAIRRGAVSLSELRSHPGGRGSLP